MSDTPVTSAAQNIQDAAADLEATLADATLRRDIAHARAETARHDATAAAIAAAAARQPAPRHAPSNTRPAGSGPAAFADSFEAARTPRTRAQRHARGGSAAAHRDHYSRTTLRERCQAAHRSNPLFSLPVLTLCDLIIPEELRPEVNSTDAAWNAKAQDHLLDWYGRCEAGGGTIEDVLETCIQAACTDGRQPMLLVERPGSGGRIQLVEDERLRNPNLTSDTLDLTAGVRRDEFGTPIEYHFAPYDKTGSFVQSGTGDWRLAHGVRVFRNPLAHEANIVAPEPACAKLLLWTERLEDTFDSTALALWTATLFGVIHKSKRPDLAREGMGTAHARVTGSDGQARSEISLAPGMMEFMETDGDLFQVDPKHPTQQFEPFAWLQMQVAFATIGVTLEAAAFRFISSYSASKAAISLGHKRQRAWRKEVRALLCDLSRWELARAVRRGVLPAPPEGWDRVRVPLAEQPVLDDQEAVKTKKLAVDANLISQRQAVAQFNQNADWKDVAEQRGDEVRVFAELGITPEGTPGASGGAGPTSPEPTGPEPTESDPATPKPTEPDTDDA